MSRPIILSNGQMLVGINRFGLVHDLYYPYVGLENHTTAKILRHLVGVWIDGKFSWLDSGEWEFKFSYEDRALIGQTTAHHAGLNVTLQFRDVVDSEEPVFIRQIAVTNHADKLREIRLMLHQGFRISNSLNGGSVQYLPHEDAILHYKGRRAFLIKTRTDMGDSFDQHSVGIYGIEGKEGTFRDAEDGELDGNNVDFGTVDSVTRTALNTPAQGTRRMEYWLTGGTTLDEVIERSRKVSLQSLAGRFTATGKAWDSWLKKSRPERFKEREQAVTQSLMLIKAHADDRGAIIASADTQMLNYLRDAYAYCWPRDAVMSLWPLIRLGNTKEARKFFGFCERVLRNDGYLMQKYQPDGAVGSSWHTYLYHGEQVLPIQEDETAAVVYLIGQFADVSQDAAYIKRLYEKLVRPMAGFLSAFIDPSTGLPKPSYELWELRLQTSTYTTGIVYGALMEAARLAELHKDWDAAIAWHAAASEIKTAAHKHLYNPKRKFFYKGLEIYGGKIHTDETVDVSSFYGAYAFGLFETDDPRIQECAKTIEETFLSSNKFEGLPRFERDPYHNTDPQSLGNPWFVTSLWLAQYYIETGQISKAEEIITWVESKMLSTGVLSEQVTAEGTPVSVAPLVWSQAEYITTVLDLQASRRRPRAR